MAEIEYTSEGPGARSLVLTWSNVTESDTFQKVAATEGRLQQMTPADIVAEVAGTVGGATIVLQGSVDGSTWTTVSDIDGSAVSFTATGSKIVRDWWPHMQFSHSGGSSEDVTARLGLTLVS